MESFVRKYGVFITLGYIGLISSLVAAISSEVVGYYLAPYRVPHVDLSVLPKEASKASANLQEPPDTMAKAIADRCLFDGCEETVDQNVCDPECQPGERCEMGRCVPAPQQVADNNGVPAESGAGIKLLGVIVASNPRFSTALIKLPTEQVSSVLSVGSKLGSIEIKEIHRDRVVFTNNGTLEFIRLDESLQGAPAPPVAAPNKAATPPGNGTKAVELDSPPTPLAKKIGDNEIADTIQNNEIAQLAPNEPRAIELNRDELRNAAKNPSALGASILPHFDNGKPAGVKLGNPSPLMSKLGLRPGDVVKNINGRSITSQMSAMDALSKLGRAKSVGIEVERNGKVESINYQIK